MAKDQDMSQSKDEMDDDSPASQHASEIGADEKSEDKIEPDRIKKDDEKDVEAAQPAETEHGDAIAGEDYSVFTVNQKRSIIVAGSFLAWFSPMTGSIYYPALNQIARDLHTSNSNINITVTTYLIFQGLAPMMIAGFSDKAGRRPAYFICFIIYIAANLGLALQTNFVALLILRMVQASGSSGTVALAQGLVGDLVVSSDRGSYVAFATLGIILGPTLSPILGGLLAQYLGWHWIFWFLLILSGAAFILTALFLPETCRNIVGDGSIPPPTTNWNLSDHIRFKNRAKKGIVVDEEKMKELRKNHRITIPNPIGTLVVLWDFETALLLLSVGVGLACFYAISTGASQAFGTLYGFDEIKISLMFIPLGGGSVISAFTTGKMLDWNYRRHARKLGFPIQKNRQADLSNFPIEKARMELALPLLLGGSAATVGYGWLMSHKVSLAGPIIMLFILGYCLIAGTQPLNVLLVDIYPGKPAAATAANNVIRCLLGAAASAAILPMSDAMGYGGAYTVLGGIFFLASIGPVFTMKFGIQWRAAKKDKANRKKMEKEAKAMRKREAQGDN